MLTVLLLGLLSLFGNRRQLRAVEAVSHADSVLQTTRAVIADLVDAETSQRGFLLTGREAYLEPYTRGMAASREELARLRVLTSDHSAQQRQVGELERLAARKMALLAHTVAAYRSGGSTAAARLIETNSGKLAMDSVRAAGAAVEALERERLEERAREERAARSAMLIVLVAGTGAAMVLILLGGSLLSRALAAEERLGAELGDQARRLDESATELEMSNEELQRSNQTLAATNAELGASRESLVTSERRYRSLVAATSSVVWSTSPAGTFLEQERGWEAYTGQGPERHAGMGWLEALHPEDRLEFQGAWMRALEAVRPCEAEARVWNAPSGAWRRSVLRLVPVLDGDGTLVEWVGALTDIEDHRRAEEQLLHGQRMQAVGKLAGGVAHEVNNQITGIIGFGEFLARGLPAGSTEQQDAQEVLRAAHRVAAITRQLLAFSRQQILQPTLLDLNAVVTESEPLLRQLIAKDLTVVTRLAPQVGPVEADRGQLEQVLVNLVLNARDAMAAGGTLTIETAEVELREELLRPRDAEALPPGRYAMLAVSDTGHGMDAATRARIFEPFFTTKPVGQGTGLGLSTVYGIIRQSGGDVWVYSEPGRGTTFKVYLPVAAPAGEELATGVPTVAAEGAPRGEETVLVVEDEEVVRTFAGRLLAELGYRVLEAGSGREALRLLNDGDAPVDLVLADVVMPEMGGRELGDALRTSHPGVPVLYMSGYTDDEVIRRGLLDAGMPFLQKPFSPHRLATKVRAMLERTESATDTGHE